LAVDKEMASLGAGGAEHQKAEEPAAVHA